MTTAISPKFKTVGWSYLDGGHGYHETKHLIPSQQQTSLFDQENVR